VLLIIFQEDSVSIAENLSRDAATASQDEFHLLWSAYENKG